MTWGRRSGTYYVRTKGGGINHSAAIYPCKRNSDDQAVYVWMSYRGPVFSEGWTFTLKKAKENAEKTLSAN